MIQFWICKGQNDSLHTAQHAEPLKGHIWSHFDWQFLSRRDQNPEFAFGVQSKHLFQSWGQIIFFIRIQRSFKTYKRFGFPFFDFGAWYLKRCFDCMPKANSGVWSLPDWKCQTKWDQICPPRDSACWAVCNESFWLLQIQNRIIFDRVVKVNVLQRLGILININDSNAVSNFSSLMDAMDFGT